MLLSRSDRVYSGTHNNMHLKTIMEISLSLNLVDGILDIPVWVTFPMWEME